MAHELREHVEMPSRTGTEQEVRRTRRARRSEIRRPEKRMNDDVRPTGRPYETMPPKGYRPGDQ